MRAVRFSGQGWPLEVLELAASRRLRTRVTTAPLDDAARVLDDLRAGRVVGRAVLVP